MLFRSFELLARANLDLGDGRYEIDGHDCYALVQSYKTRPLAQAKFEVHRQYTDIQFIVAGRETLLWAPLAMLTKVTQPYSTEKDVAFFDLPEQATPVRLIAGQFAIFFPTDGHAPCLECDGPSDVKKVVIKVRA